MIVHYICNWLCFEFNQCFYICHAFLESYQLHLRQVVKEYNNLGLHGISPFHFQFSIIELVCIQGD